jgi:hypothetical protein
MKKIKLPRRRKKAFKNTHGRDDYMMIQILGEILFEEGRPRAERFYDFVKCKPTREFPGGYKPIKRW